MRRRVVRRSGSPAVTNGMNAFLPAARSFWNTASMGFMDVFLPSPPVGRGELVVNLLALQLGDLETILVAAAGETHHDHILLAALCCLAHRLDDRVGRLQRRQDPLQ